MNNKIIKHGLEKEVIELRARGFGYIEIANQVKAIYGTQVSHMSVKRFLDSNDKVASEVLSGKEEQREKFANLKLNAIDRLLETLSMIDEFLEKHDKDWRAHSTYLDLKIKNIDIIFKLTKNIQPKEKPRIDAMAYQRMFRATMERVFEGAELKDGKLIVSNPDIIRYYKDKMKIWD